VFQKLLSFNPHLRISANEALSHLYFQDLARDDVGDSVTVTTELEHTDGHTEVSSKK